MKSVQAVHAWLEKQHPGRVHRPRAPVFPGRPGHYYLIDAPEGEQAADELLAAISARSNDAEASLFRLNDAFVVSIARANIIAEPLQVPRRTVGISRFEWLAQAHPLGLADRYPSAVSSPTPKELEVMTRAAHIWGPQSVRIVVCTSGRVVEAVTFSA